MLIGVALVLLLIFHVVMVSALIDEAQQQDSIEKGIWEDENHN